MWRDFGARPQREGKGSRRSLAQFEESLPRKRIGKEGRSGTAATGGQHDGTGKFNLSKTGNATAKHISFTDLG